MCGGAGWRGGELRSRDRLCVVGLAGWRGGELMSIWAGYVWRGWVERW